MKRTIILLILLTTISFLFTGSTNGSNDAASFELSAWTVYWDCENVSGEVKSLGNKLTEIVYFAAYFDKNNQLFIPEETTETFRKIKNMPNSMKYTNYLSIVNDKVNSVGKTSLKSTDLLYGLLSNEEALNQHINDIVNIALEGGYDGVEIDYEAIKNDTALWNMFLSFSTRLYQKLKEHNLKMRIDLESSAPIGKLNFPEGPEYVMMCYNLYGLNSKPGPKADKNFILDMADKISCLPGNKSLAFATGGFDWDENGKAKAITEQQADSLLKKYSITPLRDENSAALTFKYSDENSLKHEVWFADGSTLISWIDSISNEGNYRISLWRLNGNNKESLSLLHYLKNKRTL